MEAFVPGEGHEIRQYTPRSYETNHAPTSTARDKSARREFSFNAQKGTPGRERPVRRVDVTRAHPTKKKRKQLIKIGKKRKKCLLERERSAITTKVSGLFPTRR